MADPTVPPPIPGAAPSAPGAAPSANRQVMIALSYLWLLGLVPLLVEKDDREVQWHARHGLVWTVAEMLLWIAVWIVMVAASSVLTLLGCVVWLLGLVIGLGLVVLHIAAIVKGINGGRLIVPGLSSFADRL